MATFPSSIFMPYALQAILYHMHIFCIPYAMFPQAVTKVANCYAAADLATPDCQ